MGAGSSAAGLDKRRQWVNFRLIHYENKIDFYASYSPDLTKEHARIMKPGDVSDGFGTLPFEMRSLYTGTQDGRRTCATEDASAAATSERSCYDIVANRPEGSTRGGSIGEEQWYVVGRMATDAAGMGSPPAVQQRV